MSCPHKESCEETRRERDLLHDKLNDIVAEQLALDTGIVDLKSMAEACGLGYLMDESDEFFVGPKLEALAGLIRNQCTGGGRQNDRQGTGEHDERGNAEGGERVWT